MSKCRHLGSSLILCAGIVTWGFTGDMIHFAMALSFAIVWRGSE